MTVSLKWLDTKQNIWSTFVNKVGHKVKRLSGFREVKLYNTEQTMRKFTTSYKSFHITGDVKGHFTEKITALHNLGKLV